MIPRDQQLIRLHCDYLRRSGNTTATIHHRRANLRRLAEALDDGLLGATEDDLERWQSGLHVSLSSVATYSSHVRSFYRWAELTAAIESSPARRLPMPKIPRRHPRPMPEDDYEIALACAPEPVRTWLLLAGYMGLRAGEIARIGREDVSEVAGRLVLSGIGKGQEPFRMPVPVEVAPYLTPHLRCSRTGPLWRNAQGRPVTPHRVTQRVGEFMRVAGLPYTLHTLRHRFGTQFYAATRDPVLTQEVMRHSSLNTTRLYVAYSREEATAALDDLSASLRPHRQRRKPG